MNTQHHCDKSPSYILWLSTHGISVETRRIDELLYDKRFSREGLIIETALRAALYKQICIFCKTGLNNPVGNGERIIDAQP